MRETIKMNEELQKVLAGKEERWNKRISLSQKYKMCVISVTLCLPFKLRTSVEFINIFNELNKLFLSFMEKNNIQIKSDESINGFDGPVMFYICDDDAIRVKNYCVKFEETNEVMRILDVDVMDKNSVAISREDIAKPPRKCFICDKASAVCVSAKSHSKALIEQKAMEFKTKAEVLINNSK